jgi:hypothetical protein
MMDTLHTRNDDQTDHTVDIDRNRLDAQNHEGAFENIAIEHVQDQYPLMIAPAQNVIPTTQTPPSGEILPGQSHLTESITDPAEASITSPNYSPGSPDSQHPIDAPAQCQTSDPDARHGILRANSTSIHPGSSSPSDSGFLVVDDDKVVEVTNTKHPAELVEKDRCTDENTNQAIEPLDSGSTVLGDPGPAKSSTS